LRVKNTAKSQKTRQNSPEVTQEVRNFPDNSRQKVQEIKDVLRSETCSSKFVQKIPDKSPEDVLFFQDVFFVGTHKTKPNKKRPTPAETTSQE
jgi:hypothetical protein